MNLEVQRQGFQETIDDRPALFIRSQPFGSKDSNISIFENRSRDFDFFKEENQKPKQPIVSRCEVCNVKTRFTRAILSCCSDRMLCLRCFEHFCIMNSSDQRTCPFCNNDKVKVSKEVKGLFSPFSSQGQYDHQSRGYSFHDYDSDDGKSV